jgi:hypothetical protein
MKTLKISTKKNIHLFYFNNYASWNFIKLLNHTLFEQVVLALIKIIVLWLQEFKKIIFVTSLKFKNKDLRLLRRDLVLFFSNIIKFEYFIWIIKFDSNDCIISILRAPFVHNKSREQLKTSIFKFQIKSVVQTNILLGKYFFRCYFDQFKYSSIYFLRKIL